jgi:hypothetical protein
MKLRKGFGAALNGTIAGSFTLALLPKVLFHKVFSPLAAAARTLRRSRVAGAGQNLRL